MTEILCQQDSYLRQFDAIVSKTTNKGVVLDRTAFYPGGGGQPSDTGVLVSEGVEYRVVRLLKLGADYLHEIDGHLPKIGSSVHGKLDWERRFQLMRTHTALHIMCGVVWREYKSKVTGGDMKPLMARMDFELEHMSKDFAVEVENMVNIEVVLGRDVSINTLPREEAFQIPDLIRTKINLLPKSIKKIRVVNIQGLDLQADGGTHVANTSEVGCVRLVGHESKGRINKRLRIELAP